MNWNTRYFQQNKQRTLPPPDIQVCSTNHRADLRPWPAKLPILMVIIILVVLCIIIGALSTEKGKSESNAAANPTQPAKADAEATQPAKPETEKLNEECHVSTWEITEIKGAYGITKMYSLHNVSWQSQPIELNNVICGMLKGTIEGVKNDLELGKENSIYFDGISDNLLRCAKAIDNQKLRKLAKECNGKWF